MSFISPCQMADCGMLDGVCDENRLDGECDVNDEPQSCFRCTDHVSLLAIAVWMF